MRRADGGCRSRVTLLPDSRAQRRVGSDERRHSQPNTGLPAKLLLWTSSSSAPPGWRLAFQSCRSPGRAPRRDNAVLPTGRRRRSAIGGHAGPCRWRNSGCFRSGPTGPGSASALVYVSSRQRSLGSADSGEPLAAPVDASSRSRRHRALPRVDSSIRTRRRQRPPLRPNGGHVVMVGEGAGDAGGANAELGGGVRKQSGGLGPRPSSPVGHVGNRRSVRESAR